MDHNNLETNNLKHVETCSKFEAAVGSIVAQSTFYVVFAVPIQLLVCSQ